MKTLFLPLILVAFAAIAPTPAAAFTPNAPFFSNVSNDPLYDTDTYQALHDILIDVSWNQATLGQALRDLSLSVRSARPIASEIDFHLSSEAPPGARARRVSVVLRRAPLIDVLAYLAQQANFTIKVHPNLVIVCPK